jgi:hypothetical protein
MAINEAAASEGTTRTQFDRWSLRATRERSWRMSDVEVMRGCFAARHCQLSYEPRQSRPTAICYFCFATILYLIPSYVARGRIFFCTNSSFRWYGRPLMICSEYASPIPGSALS